MIRYADIKGLIAAVLLMTPCAASAKGLTVFAAASLKTALDQVATEFEQFSGHEVAMSFAGSSALARQIQLGAPADLFVSANVVWMDHLQSLGMIEADSRVDLLGNSLVLVGHGVVGPIDLTSDVDLGEILGEDKLAMGLVNAVPAGIYGKSALQTLGLWTAVAPKVAQSDNVRTTLALVARGEAPMGIVYETDARASDQVSVIATFPANSHAPIVYPAASIVGGDTELAKQFLLYLQSAPSQAIFAAHGFHPLGNN